MTQGYSQEQSYGEEDRFVSRRSLKSDNLLVQTKQTHCPPAPWNKTLNQSFNCYFIKYKECFFPNKTKLCKYIFKDLGMFLDSINSHYAIMMAWLLLILLL